MHHRLLPRFVPGRSVALPLALALGVGISGTALAQGQPSAAPALSSPLPAGAGGAPVAGVPSGSGAGYHSPNSPIAPLPQRNDVIPWSVLTDLTKKTTKDGILPVFNDAQKGMDKTTQRIQGFMMPLDAKATQTHFLLTSVPLTCSFCLPGGPESMVEVKAKTPVRYSLEPVVVEGRFTVLHNDQYGLYYRVVEAVPVK
ncbi:MULTISPECIES: DUF3299 domain-containing protein [unclassified Acidovorax]|uniref:DUF3299 domain-containing protein n=1 Tax=unclassified Acidovorax TaxID=2684926 RepID=UPI001C44E36D|nr:MULTISPECIES: DUF3299 domain-containing protein [unclassified Acidovorax]MBV7426713.1 DUF3299 domain-containing protein [Acidovorax sp. sif0732]MBV7447838.1 DUF3299 domain-containing protein [Acidovorax sp. sif0715]